MMHLKHNGVPIAPRDGQKTLEYPSIVCTTYTNPRERVLWCPVRDANPFFHFFEALWILAGRKDVAFLSRFNKRMADYSDNGVNFHAPYGYRLRKHFGFDQIERAIEMLTDNPDTRRVVLQIWDPAFDFGKSSKDLPCNDFIMLKARGGMLHMTVCCRSNDVIWGAYGANVVQFSMLLEYIATRAGLGVGEYRQLSDSFHVYTENPFWQYFTVKGDDLWPIHDLYADGEAAPYEGMFIDDFDRDLAKFFTAWDLHGNPAGPLPLVTYSTAAFHEVVLPMYRAHSLFKQGQLLGACHTLQHAPPCDWLGAAHLWLTRRILNGAKGAEL